MPWKKKKEKKRYQKHRAHRTLPEGKGKRRGKDKSILTPRNRAVQVGKLKKKRKRAGTGNPAAGPPGEKKKEGSRNIAPQRNRRYQKTS